jgi:thioesterase domain-containing protein/acyl-CoA synthetase (AMP-forming)/AMP-acid ligase II/SAM-dependent methyltransferase/acyl carrier protein
MVEFLKQQRISIISLSPSVLAALPEAELPHLRTLLSAGEACTADLVDRWAPGRLFINGYGPTEVTIGTATNRCFAGEGTPLVGRPFKNMRNYVLDENLEPVPVGVPGEIYIAGPGLARGYLNAAELTSERFLPCPFSGIPGDRMYKSGDRGRFHPDGRLECLGRIDSQVKIRGFRIEPGEVESLLRSEPTVRDAVVVPYQSGADETRLVAYVVPEVDAIESLNGASLQGESPHGETSAAIPEMAETHDQDTDTRELTPEGEQIAHWEEVFNTNYRLAHAAVDPTFNITGWNSSYSGKPLAEEQMRLWLDQTVRRIERQNPRRVLEIGCGNGLVLYRAAPGREEYVATDISPVALKSIEPQLADPARDLAHVRLEHRVADDFDGVPEGHFDLVVLNSVVQYFPDVAYLLRVLDGAMRSLRAGGAIFLGDVRNLPLLGPLAASIALYQSDGSTPSAELENLVRRRLESEQELAVDPALFPALCERYPALENARVWLKRGKETNELNAFRYDVLLQTHGREAKNGEPSRLKTTRHEWSAESFTLGAIAQTLQQADEANGSTHQIVVSGIPNARVVDDVRLWQLLREETEFTTSGQLREHLDATRPTNAVNPEDLWQLGEQLGWKTSVTFDASRPDQLEVAFCQVPAHSSRSKAARNVRSDKKTAAPHSTLSRNGAGRPWRAYTNTPLRGILSRRLVPLWRRSLEASLPDYMVPSTVMLLDELPRTINGKLDHRALPSPAQDRPHWAGQLVAPRDELETEMVAVWEELLGVHPVGIRDDFFDLGGHSMLAVRLISEIQTRCGRRLPLTALFQHPTVEQLAEMIRNGADSPRQPLLVPLQPRGQRRPLFCIHPAGGTVFCYYQLAREIDDDQPIYGIQAQGLDGHAAPLATIPAMAARYVEEVLSVQPEGPYQLAGWSLGGNLAYEMARQLSEQGQEVSLLALLDSGTAGPETRLTEDDFVEVLTGLFPEEVQPSLDEIRDRDVSEQLAYFIQRAAQAELVAPGADEETGHNLFEVFRATIEAMSHYQPGAYRGRVTLVRAEQQTIAMDDPTFGWGALAEEGVEVHVVPGDHVHMLQQPAVRHIVSTLEELLYETSGFISTDTELSTESADLTTGAS